MNSYIPPVLATIARRLREWLWLRRSVKGQQIGLERLQQRVEALQRRVALLEHDRWSQRRAAVLREELEATP